MVAVAGSIELQIQAGWAKFTAVAANSRLCPTATVACPGSTETAGAAEPEAATTLKSATPQTEGALVAQAWTRDVPAA
jgi:hypothetical protein